MARPCKPRKPIASGNAIKLIQHNAKIRAKISDEESRHRAKMIDLSDCEHEVHASDITVGVRSARLARIAHQRTYEMRRHHAALDRLEKRIR